MFPKRLVFFLKQQTPVVTAGANPWTPLGCFASTTASGSGFLPKVQNLCASCPGGLPAFNVIEFACPGCELSKAPWGGGGRRVILRPCWRTDTPSLSLESPSLTRIGGLCCSCLFISPPPTSQMFQVR